MNLVIPFLVLKVSDQDAEYVAYPIDCARPACGRTADEAIANLDRQCSAGSSPEPETVPNRTGAYPDEVDAGSPAKDIRRSGSLEPVAIDRNGRRSEGASTTAYGRGDDTLRRPSGLDRLVLAVADLRSELDKVAAMRLDDD